MKNHYATLGINNFEQDAAVIKKAYQAISRVCHQDIHTSQPDEQDYCEAQKQINQAYSILTGEERAAYDVRLYNALLPSWRNGKFLGQREDIDMTNSKIADHFTINGCTRDASQYAYNDAFGERLRAEYAAQAKAKRDAQIEENRRNFTKFAKNNPFGNTFKMR